MMSTCFVIGGFNFGHLVKVVSARFIHYKVTVVPFVVNKYLEGDTLRLCKSSICCPLIYFSTNLQILSTTRITIYLMVIFYFLLFFYTYSLEYYSKKELSLLSYLFIYLFNYIIISIWTHEYSFYPKAKSIIYLFCCSNCPDLFIRNIRRQHFVFF